MEKKFNSTQITNFMHNFFRYGNFNSPIWLMGLEEGGEGTFEDLQNRMNAWESMGSKELLDVKEFHKKFGDKKERFSTDGEAQKTWSDLIKLLLTISGQEKIDTEDVKSYQINRLGRPYSDHCLIELMPLPSPNTSLWPYKDYTDIQYLNTRKSIMKK